MTHPNGFQVGLFVMAKIIHDNVLGAIEIERSMLHLVDHPAMQRLRRLEQLGAASLVFPGATHTRFAHSIGAQEIMRRVWSHLAITRQPSDIDPAAEGRLLRATALLHDLGHYPLSHVVEPIAAHLNTQGLCGSAAGLDPQSESDWLQLAATVASRPVPSSALNHERLAAEIIAGDATLEAAIEEYVGTPDATSELLELVQGRTTRRYRLQLIASEFDVDRLDYLLRDAQNAGVRYGGIEVEHLIRRMRLGVNQAGDQVVYVDSRGLPALEHYVLARRFMYSQVIFHRVVTAFSVLVGALWVSLTVSDRAQFTSLDSLHRAIAEGTFRRFDDHWLWSEAARRADPDGTGLTARLATALVDRRPPLLVWEGRARGHRTWTGLLAAFGRARHAIAAEARAQVSDLFLTHQTVATTAGSEDGEANSNGMPFVGEPGGPLCSLSELPHSVLMGPSAQPEHLVRFYLLRSRDADEDQTRRSRLRKSFLANLDPGAM
jgi:HD superfamily phosphohydrolase